MIWITGDTHGDFSRFSPDHFPETKVMTKADAVIICGDFGGIFADTPVEAHWLNWLSTPVIKCKKGRGKNVVLWRR